MAAFEIRFSASDSMPEVIEIQNSVPDPFKKRDKIPRNSGIEQFTNIDNNTTPSTPPSPPQAPMRQKQRHHSESSSKKGSSTKSSNAVGPEADKQQQRVNGVTKIVERSQSLGNDAIMSANSINDDSIIRKKQRQKLDESVTEKEKCNLDKGTITNHQIMNGKPDVATSKKIMSKINKYKDENIPLPKDGIATPPATPPRSPYISQKRSEDVITMDLDPSQPETPPSSSDSTKSFTPSPRKRRGSQPPQRPRSMLSTKRSIEMNAYQPPKKLQQPRGRRMSSTGKYVTNKESHESFTTPQSLNKKQARKSQSQPPRSRIPRLSISSRERPVIAQKVSQGSLSSQDSNKFNDVTSSIEPPRQLRLAPSRPIINTSLISDIEVGSELPTDNSPTDNPLTNHPSSPTSHSSSNHSPTNPSSPRRIVSHDDVVIPTIAKKLKMKGQLPFVNHDALLGYSEEPEEISPMSENGYMDITDQVVNLFDSPKSKSHRRQSSIPDSQNRHQQRNSSRNSNKTHYIAPRKQLPQQSSENVPSPTGSQFEDSFEHSAPHNVVTRNKRGRARREEYIISVRENDDDVEFIESHSSTTLVPSEPSTVPPVQIESNEKIEQAYQEKVEELEPVQIPVQISVVKETVYDPIPAEAVSAPTVTSNKKRKGRKKKQKKSSSGNLDEDEYVLKSRCRCAIQ